VNGEVSADGHNWTMGAYATDYLEKNWPTFYGGRGGEYPGEGSIKIANNKNGFLWDYCKRNGVTYRTYAEFMGDKEPNIPVLKNHFCPQYTPWDLSVRDTVRFRQWKHDFDSLLAVDDLPQLNTLRLEMIIPRDSASTDQLHLHMLLIMIWRLVCLWIISVTAGCGKTVW